MRLSNASSGRLTDGEATGTIENRDPLPRALLARFGRTAAVHVVEQVEERLEARRAPGFEAVSRAGSCGGGWSARLRRTSCGSSARRPGWMRRAPGRRSRWTANGGAGWTGVQRRGPAAAGPRGRRRADRLGLRADRADRPRGHALVLEPGGAVALCGARRRAVAGGRRADDDVRGGLRQGAR